MILALLLSASLTAVDGDTVKDEYGQNMRLLGGGTPFVSGIDTPEIGSHAKCEKERKLALLAKRRLKDLIEGKDVHVEVKGRDKFGRPLVNLYVEGREIGAQLLREGFAKEWRKGKRNDWCSP
ncbi:nuclease [Neorhizobium sp. SOG26]|uniref:thermonuclease family protein n=1 Tax=Neorhizobium sp. SOG26 TaxID=2060726 RepID=UPI000E57301B|nr:thermonuclease family protein [Neorhizobium sp. SOG26]AXV15138.1 nuclease [Neorhizobium sp. SOG26]